MSPGEFLLGVDVGNTNVKCVALAPGTGVLRVASVPTATARTAVPGQAGVLSMEGLWRAVCTAVRGVLGQVGASFPDARLVGVAVASAGAQAVFLDSTGDVIGLPEGDAGRTEAYRQYLHTHGSAAFFRATGYPLEPHWAPFRAALLRERMPHAFDRLDRVLSISGYLNYRLTGENAFEPTLIGSLVVRRAAAGDFWDDLLRDVHLDRSLFGREVPSGGLVGEVSERAELESGIPAGVPVFAGPHDYLAAAFAAGPWLGNAVLDVLGTYEIIATFHDHPRTDSLPVTGRGFVDTDATGERYSYMIEAFAGGRMHWFRELLRVPALNGTADALSDLLAPVPNGSSRPLYFPGDLDDQGVGTLIGLEAGHTAFDVLDSVFLGLTFLTVAAFHQQLTLAPEATSVCAVGGMSANTAWMQTKSDILGIPVVVPLIPEATASGAALLAGVGAHLFSGYAEASSALHGSRAVVYEPDMDRHRRFREFCDTTYAPLRTAVSELRPASQSATSSRRSSSP